jgi:hypothetical protein
VPGLARRLLDEMAARERWADLRRRLEEAERKKEADAATLRTLRVDCYAALAPADLPWLRDRLHRDAMRDPQTRQACIDALLRVIATVPQRRAAWDHDSDLAYRLEALLAPTFGGEDLQLRRFTDAERARLRKALAKVMPG